MSLSERLAIFMAKAGAGKQTLPVFLPYSGADLRSTPLPSHGDMHE
jgi:hypothetical protein